MATIHGGGARITRKLQRPCERNEESKCRILRLPLEPFTHFIRRRQRTRRRPRLRCGSIAPKSIHKQEHGNKRENKEHPFASGSLPPVRKVPDQNHSCPFVPFVVKKNWCRGTRVIGFRRFLATNGTNFHELMMATARALCAASSSVDPGVGLSLPPLRRLAKPRPPAACVPQFRDALRLGLLRSPAVDDSVPPGNPQSEIRHFRGRTFARILPRIDWGGGFAQRTRRTRRL
jgi:hypothetical protein